MKIYLSGPMRGIAHFNKPAFDAAAKRLRGYGWEVFSPAEADVARYGDAMFAHSKHGCEEEAKKHGFDLRSALGADLAWIVEQADAIAMLPNWHDSRGAKAEYYTAVALGLTVMRIDHSGDITITEKKDQ